MMTAGSLGGRWIGPPALQRLLADIAAGRVDTVVVYKIDRLTRSLTDFAKIVEILDARGTSFVSVTQQFNTTTSMGRLTLNVLLSLAQFEREVIGERIRDKIAASKKKGCGWAGCHRSGIGCRTASSSSSTARRKSCARSSAAMPNSARCGC
jgi:site-specific DNA recombinase